MATASRSTRTRAARPRPEHWEVEARAGRDVAHLDIPADAVRERRFEIHCTLAVAYRARAATHALRVLVDGAHEWARRIDTDPGPRDGLEVRFSRIVPAGRPLRVTALAEVDGATLLGLAIVADEE